MKKNKYGAVRTIIDGIKFASKKESIAYSSYKIMERAGLISDLVCHPVFHVIWPSGVKICKVILDFSYYDISENRYRYIDVKGKDKETGKFRLTRESALKKKLVEEAFKIEVEYV